MRPVKLNKKSIKKATSFVFDGCHKIYLLKKQDNVDEVKEYGYTIYPIEELEETFKKTCSLRFINWWDNLDSVIPQCTDSVIFTYSDGTKSRLLFVSL